MAARLQVLLAVMLLAFAAPAPRNGHAAPLLTPGPRFSLTPHRLDRCKAFLVVEASGSRVAMNTEDRLDEFIVSDGLGVMVNVNSSWAVGGVVELYWARGAVKVAPVVRCRRWFGREQSLEASVGYLGRAGAVADPYTGAGSQLVGPIASVRYSPVPVVFAQVGLCRFQVGDYLFSDFGPGTAGREVTKLYGGAGMSGGGGAVLWGLEALALAGLLVFIMGSD
jgi:hypothetical protein